MAALLALLGLFSGPWAVAALSERDPLPPAARLAAWRAFGGLLVLAAALALIARRLPTRRLALRAVLFVATGLAPLVGELLAGR